MATATTATLWKKKFPAVQPVGFIARQDLLIRHNCRKSIDVMKRWYDKRSRHAGANRDQFLHIECRIRKIQIALRRSEINQLFSTYLALFLFTAVEISKEFCGCDVVIFDDAATAEFVYEFEAIPSS